MPYKIVHIIRTVSAAAFPFKDRLGRVIGATAYLENVSVVRDPTEEDLAAIAKYQSTYKDADRPAFAWEHADYCKAPFRTYVTATRDGKSYGASQPGRYFDTEAAQREDAAKYLADAGKRAGKVKGAVPA